MSTTLRGSDNFTTDAIAKQAEVGVAYIDPDAVGANPTALIFTDGTVVGSTDNGNYIKYPNGDLEIKIIDPATYVTTVTIGAIHRSGGHNYTPPIELVGQSNIIASTQSVNLYVWPGRTNQISSLSVSGEITGSNSTASGKLSLTIKGKWK